MKRPIWRPLVLAALWALAACERSPAPASIVAHGAGHELTVDDVVALLVGESYPNEMQVAYTVGELWLDYILLAAAVSDDPALGQIDVSRIVGQQVEQELILALREATVQPDTTVSDEELRRRYAEVAPGARARVRHIFLATPPNATPAQRDSVRAVTESLRSRILSGESFEALAVEHSDDPGTASAGGDLGIVNRNELFGPLDSAAFALDPGSVSEVVESVYGYHVLRVDERNVPSLEEVLPEFRAALQQERVLAAESTLIASVEADANIEMETGAVDLARRAVQSPGMQLSRRASRRPLVTYRDGELTMGEVLTFMQGRPSQQRVEIYSASDEAIEQNLLLSLAQRELLAEAARERGLSVPEARLDSLTQTLRDRILGAARELGLAELPQGDDEAAKAVRNRHVQDLIRDLLRGEREIAPLGSFSFILRESYGGQVSLPAVQRVVTRIDEARGPDSTAPGEEPIAPALPPADSAPPAADSTGGPTPDALPPGDGG